MRLASLINYSTSRASMSFFSTVATGWWSSLLALLIILCIRLLIRLFACLNQI
jgi:hypothetical protein